MSNSQNKQSSDNLQELDPIDAIQVWLDGAFGIGDESAMIKAIRKDKRIILPDEEITDIVCDAMGENLDAHACLERLISH